MEVNTSIMRIKKWVRFCVCTVVLLLAVEPQSKAQAPIKVYTIKKGRMYIELSRSLSEPSLDSFINKFKLSDLALKKFVKQNIDDSITINGWQIDKRDDGVVAISKPLLSSDMINAPSQLSIAERFPAVKTGQVMGFNNFKKGKLFEVYDSVVRFVLPGYADAKRVMLAGSFNAFSPTALAMQKNDSGWFANVRLSPGKYWYKFIIDGNWKVDENNFQRENDGEGNTNSVYYKTNTIFRLNRNTDAKRVFVAGSFNNWHDGELAMQRTATGWQLPLYLAEGTYTYRFVADGNWFPDPENPDRVPNEFNDVNSVIKKGRPYLFRLNGFLEARKVVLTGSFNDWRKYELLMGKTATGWELPYGLGLGNFEYRFIVDGAEITDPANPLFTNNDRKKGNSILILGANYTFRLKAYPDAKTVFLSGDFNDFNPTAFAMHKEGNEWVYAVHLSVGKHLYKFVVDGKWIIDPQNKLWEQNQFSTGNSILWIEKEQ